MVRAVVAQSALPPLPSIFERAVELAEDTTQAAVAVPLVLPIVGVEPSAGTSEPAEPAAQRYTTEPLAELKSELLEVVQFKVTCASPAEPLVAVAPLGDKLSIVKALAFESEPA